MTVYTDNFNRADGAIGASWGTPAGASLTISSNTAIGASPSTEYTARYESDLAGVDHYCLAKYTSSSSGAYFPAVAVRYSSSLDTCYRLYINDGKITITRVVNGAGTDLVDSAAQSFNNSSSYWLRLEVTGSGATVSLAGYLYASDGTTLLKSVTFDDTSGSRLTTGTRGGLYVWESVTPGAFDDFTVADILPATQTVTLASALAQPETLLAPTVSYTNWLTPNGDGTSTNFTTTGSDFNSAVDDNPYSSNETQYISCSSATGSIFLSLSNTPFDFVTASSVRVVVNSGSVDGTGTLYAQLYDAGEVTAMSDEVVVRAYSDSIARVDSVTLTGLDATERGKAKLDTAVLRLRWA